MDNGIIIGVFTLSGTVLGCVVSLVTELVLFHKIKKYEIRKTQSKLINSAYEYAKLEQKSAMYERMFVECHDQNAKENYFAQYEKEEKAASKLYNEFFISFDQYFDDDTVEEYHKIVDEARSGSKNLGQVVNSIRELFKKYKMVKNKHHHLFKKDVRN